MPYYKRRYRKRYRGRRRRRQYANSYCKPKAMDYARAAYTGVKYLKGLVNSEMLHHPLTGTATPSSSGTVLHLTNIVQGDSDNNRTGNSIFLKSIFIRMVATLHASASSTFVRVILFKDTQQVGDTSPAVTDVLETASYLSPLSSSSGGRFSVLKDVLFNINDVSRDVHILKWYVKQQLHVRYNGTASTDIQKNGLYVLFISSEATNSPSLPYNIRLSYHDN